MIADLKSLENPEPPISSCSKRDVEHWLGGKDRNFSEVMVCHESDFMTGYKINSGSSPDG